MIHFWKRTASLGNIRPHRTTRTKNFGHDPKPTIQCPGDVKSRGPIKYRGVPFDQQGYSSLQQKWRLDSFLDLAPAANTALEGLRSHFSNDIDFNTLSLPLEACHRIHSVVFVCFPGTSTVPWHQNLKSRDHAPNPIFPGHAANRYYRYRVQVEYPGLAKLSLRSTPMRFG